MRNSVRKRLYLGFGLVLILSALAIGLCVHCLKNVSESYGRLLAVQLALQYYSGQIEVAVGQCENAEKDFVAKPSANSLSRQDGRVAGILATAKILQELSDGNGFKDIVEDAKRIAAKTKDYQEQFKELSDGVFRRGATEDDGLQGEFRKAAHELEAFFEGDNAWPEARISLLQIRRHEKDYLLRDNRGYFNDTKQELDTLRGLVASHIKDAGQRQRVETLLNGYQQAFTAIVMESGSVKSVKVSLSMAAKAIPPLCAAIHGKAAALKERMVAEQARQVKLLLGAAVSLGVLALLVGLVSALALGRAIAKPIQAVSAFAASLSRGDISGRVGMGRAANCSKLSKCGKADCPSFGKKAFCWVESGSFSNSPQCPKVLEGMDCRACAVYRRNVPDELAEMGSFLNAMADEIALKTRGAVMISEGDLTQSIHVASAQDQLGKALERMAEELIGVIAGVKTAAARVDGGSNQVSCASASLSQGSTQQAAALEQISSSLQQIGAQSQANSGNAGEAAALAKAARTSAELGDQRMAQMLEATAEIGAASKKVAKVVKVIDELAFQTSILALNAAVEAARAGRQGRGFAVVAEEVRSLADRSAKAALETSELIAGALGKIDAGAGFARDAAASLRDIKAGTAKVADIVNEIAIASEEQAKGLVQIGAGLGQIEQATMQATASSEETAAAAEELAAQARDLNAVFAKFKLREDTVEAPPAPPVPPTPKTWGTALETTAPDPRLCLPWAKPAGV